MMPSIKLINDQRGKWLQWHRQTVGYRAWKPAVRSGPVRQWLLVTCVYSWGLRSYGGGSGEKGDSGELWKGIRFHCRNAKRVTEKVVSVYVWVCECRYGFCNVWVFWYQVYLHLLCFCIVCSVFLYCFVYVYIYIQGVPGGMCQTSGECSLGQTIPI